MTDYNLIAAGCGVAFIGLCGVYVFVRDRFEHATYNAEPPRAVVAAAPLASVVRAPE